MKTKSLSLASLISFGTLFAIPINAESVNSCQEAEWVVHTSLNKLGIITEEYTSDANQGRFGNPTDRDLEVLISMEGNKAEDVLYSPQLMKSLANTYGAGCNNIAIVSFGLNASDWIVEFHVDANEGFHSAKWMEVEWGLFSGPVKWGYYY